LATEYKAIRKEISPAPVPKDGDIKGTKVQVVSMRANGGAIVINKGTTQGVAVGNLLIFDLHGFEGYVVEVYEFRAKVLVYLPNTTEVEATNILNDLKGFTIPKGKTGDKSSTTAANTKGVAAFLGGQKDAANEALAKAAGIRSYALIKDSASSFAQQLNDNFKKQFTQNDGIASIAKAYIRDAEAQAKATRTAPAQELDLPTLTAKLSADIDKTVAIFVKHIINKFYLKANQHLGYIHNDWYRLIESMSNSLLNPNSYSADKKDWIKGVNYHNLDAGITLVYKTQFESLKSK
jgi:hypothetical protein